MSPFVNAVEEITPEFVDSVSERLQRNLSVRRRLPGGGRLHIERRLPFLCVYRDPAGEVGDTARLVEGEASYLIISGGDEHRRALESLVNRIADVMVDSFGAFLLLEVWTAAEGSRAPAPRPVRRPTFRVITGSLPADDSIVIQLERALAAIPLRPPPLDVEVSTGKPAPEGLPGLLQSTSVARHAIGIEVQPVYRQARTGTPYPMLFETLRQGLAVAIRKTAYHFALTHTSHTPVHYHALGRRTAVRAAGEVDGELTEISRSFDFLLQVTPVNAPGAAAEFFRRGGEHNPSFDYRPLVVDVNALKRRLFNLPMEHLEDPTLGTILGAARDELDRRITMLGDRNTPRFLYGSLSLYGTVSEELAALAIELLSRLSEDEGADDIEGETSEVPGRVNAQGFAQLAEAEIAKYREHYPPIEAKVEIRGDISGLMVSRGDLLIGQRLNIPEARANALLHHEVGTHIVTYYNGLAQPLGQLAMGLPGYEELQEGIAVLAEHLVGGLGPARVRLLAGRVIAVRALIDGAGFVDAFRLLRDTHGFSDSSAFNICMRVYRSGGLTKDAVYLRGLVGLLKYLRDGGDFDILFTGKVAFSQLPAVRELLWREYLKPPAITPAYLASPGVRGRLGEIRNGRTILDLIQDLSR
jgi:uncharacterized protein (TIGR02421 family)